MKKIRIITCLLLASLASTGRDPAKFINAGSLETRDVKHIGRAYRPDAASPDKNNSKCVVKLNLVPLFIACINGQFEYGFHKNFSIALGAHYLTPRPLPTLLFSEKDAGDGKETFASTEFKGWGFTPEIRWYPGAKVLRQAPHGFYLAAYMRYAKYTVDANYFFYDDQNSFRFNLNAAYAGTTFGGMIGAQWLLGKHFSVDWWIAGLGLGAATLEVQASSPDIYLDQAQRDQITKESIERYRILQYVGSPLPEVEVTSNSIKVKAPGVAMTSVRWGLCLGYTF